MKQRYVCTERKKLPPLGKMVVKIDLELAAKLSLFPLLIRIWFLIWVMLIPLTALLLNSKTGCF